MAISPRRGRFGRRNRITVLSTDLLCGPQRLSAGGEPKMRHDFNLHGVPCGVSRNTRRSLRLLGGTVLAFLLVLLLPFAASATSTNVKAFVAPTLLEAARADGSRTLRRDRPGRPRQELPGRRDSTCWPRSADKNEVPAQVQAPSWACRPSSPAPSCSGWRASTGSSRSPRTRRCG